jgi:type IV pilus assembly protein PilV
MLIMKKQKGFSLLEVLITMVVVAVGLLGVAGMQVSAIKLAANADIRSRASVHITEIIERISAYNSTNSRDPVSRIDTYATSFASTPTAVSTPGSDLLRWKTNLAADLPSGQGEITIANDADCAALAAALTGVTPCRVVTVTVRWDESRTERGTLGGLVSFSSSARF